MTFIKNVKHKPHFSLIFLSGYANQCFLISVFIEIILIENSSPGTVFLLMSVPGLSKIEEGIWPYYGMVWPYMVSI